MKTVNKFYISSFLKNQTYFTPLLIVFLQAQSLNFSQIFWVFTIGSTVSFITEIPTGVLADFYGKKKSVILSKSLIFLSYLTFGFADSFWFFVIAQSFYELGNSFRTGTETAFIYDFLKQNQNQPGFTEVKGKQKFWARVGESIATASGGVMAAAMGFNWVFFLAAIPAFANIINSILWPEIKEQQDKHTLRHAVEHAKSSVCQLCHNRNLLIITLNIAIFTSVLAAVNKFIQPYMTDLGIPIEYFGFIYAGSLALTALATRYSYKVENKFGSIKTVNVITLLSIIPMMIIGFKLVSYVGVGLFFIILIIENLRAPIANNAFHKLVSSKERATLGSVLSQSKSVGKILLLPVAGYLTDTYSMYTAVLILAGILLINGLFFYFREEKHGLNISSPPVQK